MHINDGINEVDGEFLLSDVNAISSIVNASVLQQIDQIGEQSVVHFDVTTGDVSVDELLPGNLFSDKIEPHIPNGITIAKPQAFSRSIIGNDDRQQIVDVNMFPYCATVYIEIVYENGGEATGTGSIVAPNTVLTAGHVIYHETYGAAVSFTLYPGGKNCGYQSVTATSASTPGMWVSSGGKFTAYDYGVISLDEWLLCGNLGMASYVNSALNTLNVTVYGYPSDKPEGTLWYSTGTISSVGSYNISHTADTGAGQSGSPILEGSTHYIVGIHTTAASSVGNSGVRITNEVVTFVQNAIAANE